MKLVPKFTQDQLRQAVLSKMEVIENAVVSRLQFVGEEFVRMARLTNTYKDQTGNLRNSIGYIILKNGEQIFENFTQSAHVELIATAGDHKGQKVTTTGSVDGTEKGKQFAELAKVKFPKGYVLIVVAGMEYAAAVEAKGYDVLTGSSQTAEKLLKDGFQELQNKLAKVK